MKKLMLFITLGLIPFIMACPSKNKVSSADSVKMADSVTHAKKTISPDSLLRITLNGIDSARADTMKKNFLAYRGKDKRPIQQSVWFDSVTINRMVRLLNKEIKEQLTENPNRTDTTDGIRIYFGSNTPSKKGRLKTTILLVSTKNAGIDNTVPSQAKHADYYTHPKDILFSGNINSINGLTLPRQWFNIRGENLYNIYISGTDVATCKDPHYISRGRAYKMVNQFGKDTIKTISEWFDIKLFRAFAADIVHDGIRVYFCKHPQNYKGAIDTDSTKEAFVLITTRYKKFLGKVYHNDYFDCTTTQQFFFNNKRLSYWYKRHPLVSGGGDDNGEICPTHCN
jgi:hypothetical protein